MTPSAPAPAEHLPPPRLLSLATLGLLLSALVVFGLPYLLHEADPGAGGFGLDRLNIIALAALYFIATLHLGLSAYRTLFPRFRKYQSECLEGEGKLFENLTEGLLKVLDVEQLSPETITVLQERRRVLTFSFIIRCVRLSFCLLVLFHLLDYALKLLQIAALSVPGELSSLPL